MDSTVSGSLFPGILLLGGLYLAGKLLATWQRFRRHGCKTEARIGEIQLRGNQARAQIHFTGEDGQELEAILLVGGEHMAGMTVPITYDRRNPQKLTLGHDSGRFPWASLAFLLLFLGVGFLARVHGAAFYGACALLALAAAGYIFWNKGKLKRLHHSIGIQTTGTVDHIVLNNNRMRMQLHYTGQDGKAHTVAATAKPGERYAEGQQVPVSYLPGRPDSAILKPGASGRVAVPSRIPALLTLAFLIILLAFFHLLAGAPVESSLLFSDINATMLILSLVVMAMGAGMAAPYLVHRRRYGRKGIRTPGVVEYVDTHSPSPQIMLRYRDAEGKLHRRLHPVGRGADHRAGEELELIYHKGNPAQAVPARQRQTPIKFLFGCGIFAFGDGFLLLLFRLFAGFQ